MPAAAAVAIGVLGRGLARCRVAARERAVLWGEAEGGDGVVLAGTGPGGQGWRLPVVYRRSELFQAFFAADQRAVSAMLPAPDLRPVRLGRGVMCVHGVGVAAPRSGGP